MATAASAMAARQLASKSSLGDSSVIKRMTSIEVLIPATQQDRGTFYFPDDNLLRTKTITGIFVQRQADDTNEITKSCNGYSLIPNAALERMFVTIETDNVNVIQKVPLSFFAGGSFDRDQKLLYIRGFNPTKSQITTGDPAGVAAALTDGVDYAVQILFTYED
ncbi:MAG: hypothetical protein AAGI23_09375 [Bacteroidota bacterium]